MSLSSCSGVRRGAGLGGRGTADASEPDDGLIHRGKILFIIIFFGGVVRGGRWR